MAERCEGATLPLAFGSVHVVVLYKNGPFRRLERSPAGIIVALAEELP
jgi:hypothetical protein